MSLVVKGLCIVGMLMGYATCQAREVHILVVGDGTASNCNETFHAPVQAVRQIGLDGVEKPVSGSFDWADCKGGSIWLSLGEKLVSAGVAQKVVFMPVVVARSSIRDWLTGGAAFAKLTSAMQVADRKHIKFDYLLWQQGYFDVDTDEHAYFNGLRSVVKSIRRNANVDKWIFARGRGCPGDPRFGFQVAQQQIGAKPVFNRFVGPDTSLLDSRFSNGGCALNRAGQEELASQWFHSIRQADIKRDRYQKESLLYYFRN